MSIALTMSEVLYSDKWTSVRSGYSALVKLKKSLSKYKTLSTFMNDGFQLRNFIVN